QKAVNFLVKSQHDAGGWRYHPGEAGDTSVVGWVVMALKSAQMAGLEVPELTMKKAIRYLDSCKSDSDGYGYVGKGATPRMSAVGLLCRQYLQGWASQNPAMINGVKNHIKTVPPSPGRKDIYYYYYATQVMHHYGTNAWTEWNDVMRELLIKTQDRSGKA